MVMSHEHHVAFRLPSSYANCFPKEASDKDKPVDNHIPSRNSRRVAELQPLLWQRSFQWMPYLNGQLPVLVAIACSATGS